MWETIQLILVVILASCGVAGPSIGPHLGLEPPAIGAFTGALIGAAAAMLGALLTRLQLRADGKSADAKRRSAAMALIAAELVNFATAYISLHKTMKAALQTISRTPGVSGQLDLSNELPRSFLTSTLGTELLLLSPREIDVLVTLKSNAEKTQKQLEEIATNKRSIGLLTAPSLANAVAHDMEILAQAFDSFTPSRKLELPGEPPEGAAVLLRRLAAKLTALASSG